MLVCEFCGREYEEDPFEPNQLYSLCPDCLDPFFLECEQCGSADSSVMYDSSLHQYLCGKCSNRISAEWE